MDDLTKEQFLELLARKRRELKGLEEVFAARFGDTSAATVPTGTQYATIRPIFAIESYLRRKGKPVEYSELSKELIDGGAALGRQKPELALSKSVNFNANLGKLTVNGKIVKNADVQSADLIGLAEWLTAANHVGNSGD